MLSRYLWYHLAMNLFAVTTAVEVSGINRREFLRRTAIGLGVTALAAVASDQVSSYIIEREREDDSWAGDYAGV